MKAWHFVKADKKLGYDDGRIVRVGRTLKVNGEPILCEHGLHASVRVIDALDYAESSILTRVELGGTILKGSDKVVATERTVLWMGDISDILHRFSCNEAERALNVRKSKGEPVDERSINAIRVKRLWLDGRATDAELAAARDAAWAACAAARAAARAAACAAARAAAWAARDAAWAACAAARDAARAAQNKRLTAMIRRAMK